MGTLIEISDIKEELLYGLSSEVVERWRPRPVKNGSKHKSIRANSGNKSCTRVSSRTVKKSLILPENWSSLESKDCLTL